MKSLIPFGETIVDERAKHAMLFVDAVEECADVTIGTERAPGELTRLHVGFHILTLIRVSRYGQRSGSMPPGSIQHLPRARPGTLAASYSLRPALPTVHGDRTPPAEEEEEEEEEERHTIWRSARPDGHRALRRPPAVVLAPLPALPLAGSEVGR